MQAEGDYFDQAGLDISERYRRSERWEPWVFDGLQKQLRHLRILCISRDMKFQQAAKQLTLYDFWDWVMQGEHGMISLFYCLFVRLFWWFISCRYLAIFICVRYYSDLIILKNQDKLPM
mgnify:CR=1 FL=1